MIISRAQRDDVAGIVALEAVAFPEAERWTTGSWAGEIDALDRLVLVGRDASGEVIAAATFQCIEDVADLHRIMIADTHRGRGYARRLMVAGMQWAAAIGARRILLEVRQDNEVAIRLYRRHDFTPIGTRLDYYGPGVHAVVMAADLAFGRGVRSGDEWAIA